jgi:hypothetical protein
MAGSRQRAYDEIVTTAWPVYEYQVRHEGRGLCIITGPSPEDALAHFFADHFARRQYRDWTSIEAEPTADGGAVLDTTAGRYEVVPRDEPLAS